MKNAFDLSCPDCKGTDLDIQALVWVHLTEDGTDADNAHDNSQHWEDGSWYLCRRCAQQGHVAALQQGDG